MVMMLHKEKRRRQRSTIMKCCWMAQKYWRGQERSRVSEGLEMTFVYRLTEMQQSGDPEKGCLTLPETA